MRGFAEAALRHERVDGCKSSLVAFLELIFVEPARRRKRLARAPSGAVEDRRLSRGAGTRRGR
jgi:aminoglycoside 6'-N-acetyltransferase I